MSVRRTLQRLEAEAVLGAIGLGLAFGACAACGDGELESVSTFATICLTEPRLSVSVTLLDDAKLPVDSVTATRTTTEHCYLEAVPRNEDAGNAGDTAETHYACWDQGAGTYVIRVTSGERTWAQELDVPGDDCRVSEVPQLTFVLDDSQ